MSFACIKSCASMMTFIGPQTMMLSKCPRDLAKNTKTLENLKIK
jgi:hypothetical protein